MKSFVVSTPLRARDLADQYEVAGATGPAPTFAGPRCTPTVADGKVVTFGVRGHLNCYDAASGKALWRKNDFPGAFPMFFTSASPLVVDGLCIAQVGKRDEGGIVAYDLMTGAENGNGPRMVPLRIARAHDH